MTKADVQAAERRMQETLSTLARATTARYDPKSKRIVIRLKSGLEIAFSPYIVKELYHAKPTDLAEVEISPTGLGLHFPKLDVDLYIPRLITKIRGAQ